MLDKISQHLKAKIQQFPLYDQIIFNNQLIEINKDNFQPIPENPSAKSIAFVDGGQAEIISAGNFCVSFIRAEALVYQENKKVQELKHEFYLLTTAKYGQNEIMYEAAIFPLQGKKIIDEEDLTFSSTDPNSSTGPSLKTGIDFPPAQLTSVARRFTELALAKTISADIIVLDGTLEPSYPNEEKYLSQLPTKVCALAKSSSLFTASGNSPVILLYKLGPSRCWSYHLENKNYFAKLHEKAKHVFRYAGKKEFLPYLAKNSADALFLGYPYGLIAVDRLARVSNEEKKSLRMKLLLKMENKEIAEYLSTSNAHQILDNLG